MQLLTREGPDVDEVQIIGVELAITPPDMGREVELEMFACKHTLPAAQNGWEGYHRIRVTLHTSRGDRSLIQDLRL